MRRERKGQFEYKCGTEGCVDIRIPAKRFLENRVIPLIVIGFREA